jgi:hypothetical protein
MRMRQIRLAEAAVPTPAPGTFLMWHGSRKWDGSPEIRAPRKGRYEAGPGIYLTTNYLTASKYAKGGGATMLAEVSSDLSLAQTAEIALAAVLAFVKSNRIRHKAEIAADLQRHAARIQRDSVPAFVLINLVVNYEAGSGDAGLAVARFLREQGIDGSLERQSTEDWLVIINPRVIQSMKRISAKDVPTSLYHLPLVRDMIKTGI